MALLLYFWFLAKNPFKGKAPFFRAFSILQKTLYTISVFMKDINREFLNYGLRAVKLGNIHEPNTRIRRKENGEKENKGYKKNRENRRVFKKHKNKI
jgi:hypothetical protein